MERSVRVRWWLPALLAIALPRPVLCAAIPADGDLGPPADLGQAEAGSADTGPAVSAAVADVVTECLPRLSLDCAQWRMARLIRFLDAVPQFPLLEGLVYVVRVGTDATQPRLATLSSDRDGEVGEVGGDGGSGGEGSRQFEAAVSDFFERHVLRLQLPMWFGDAVRPNTVDFALKPDADAGSARKKKGGKKGMKKMMMMISMMMMGKMMMVLPMVMTIIKLKAIKALLIGSLALMISKIMLIKKLLGSKLGGGGGGGGASDKHVIVLHADTHGGGGGHGGSGPSGGGGDWSSGGGGGGGGGWMGGAGGGGGGGGDWSSRGADFRSIDDAHELAYRGQLASSGWSASQRFARR